MKITIIVAASENGCIGKDNKIPWHFTEDMKWFKKNTINHPVIMGRKTFDSLGKPLPNRMNCVLTKQKISHDGVFFYNYIDECLNHLHRLFKNQCFIIGGSNIYEMFLPIANEILLTRIPGNYDGDTFFPIWPIGNDWKISETINCDNDDLSFVKYIPQ